MRKIMNPVETLASAFFGESIYRKMEASSLNPQNGYKAMSTMKISMTRKLIST